MPNNLQSLTEWLKEINDLPHPRIMRKKLEMLTDDQVLELLQEENADYDNIILHIPYDRAKLIVNKLFEMRPDLFVHSSI